jgi:hypothetical protein
MKFLNWLKSQLTRLEHHDGDPLTYGRVANLFSRSLGLVYFLAFLSLAVQVRGLIGEGGILPLASLIRYFSESKAVGFFDFPTIFWLDQSDFFIQFVCYLGAALSLPLMLGRWTIFCLVCNWGLYLSLVYGGQAFLSFQWDILLLEVGFLTVVIQRWSVAGVWLFRWLLFRLMLESGMVKLFSGDQSWRDLSALSYHFFTQPIPNPMAFFMHHLPEVFLKASALFMYLPELLLTPFILLGRRFRLVAFFFCVALQLGIIATGNYGFFNLLTLALCLWLLDDLRISSVFRIDSWPRSQKGLRRVCLVLLMAFVPLGANHIGQIATKSSGVDWITQVDQSIRKLFLINRYGLFAVMTKTRPEIQIEGSQDGVHWRVYPFKYKVNGRMERPPVVAPHMPRLDWQMWFAALGSARQSHWFTPFLKRLLEGAPEVLDLLEDNPFPDTPPKFIRAQLYHYKFSDREVWWTKGEWWQRELKGVYYPKVSL